MARKKKPARSTWDSPHGGFIEVGRDILIERLSLLKTVLLRRALRKNLATVHVVVNPDGVTTIAATNLEVGLLLKLPVLAHAGSGRVMIDARALDVLLGAYTEPRVRIHLDDPETIRVEGVQAKLKLPGADPDKEMKHTPPGSLTTSGWIVRADALASALRRTRFAMDGDGGTRYALNGLALHFPTDDGGLMEIVETDGRRLSVVRLPVRPHGTDPARRWRPAKPHQPMTGIPVLPGRAVTTLLRLAVAAEDTSVGFAILPGDPIDLEKDEYKPGRIQAVTRDAVLTAQCPEGRYPIWRDVYPTDLVVAAFQLDDASRLGALLKTAVAACDSEHKGIDVTMAGDCVMLESGSDTKGQTQLFLTGVPITGRGTATYDGLWLRQFFDVIGDTPIQVKFFGPKAPLMIHAGPDHDFALMSLSRASDYTPAPAAPPEATPDEPEGDGSAPVDPAPPEPPVPVGATPDAHQGNGKARHTK